MAFNDKHKTVSDSEPVFLYSITLGSVIHRHTAAELPITVGSTTWGIHKGIMHTGVTDSGEAAANEVTISLGSEHPVAVYLSGFIPAHEISVEIHMLERADVAEELVLYWSGVFTSYRKRFPNFDLICEPGDYETRKQAMSPVWGPDCQWSQYDVNCGLSPLAFVETGSVISVDGLTINTDADLTAVAADHFQGGYIEISGSQGLERAWIISQSGSNVVVDRALPAMAAGISISVIPSCRGDFTRCEQVFNNRIRFVGAPHASGVNPYRGDGVNATRRNN